MKALTFFTTIPGDVATQGTGVNHWSDSDEALGQDNPVEYIFGFEFSASYCFYETERQVYHGTGFVPFNSTNIPPVNIFIVEACSSGVDDGFVGILWPYVDFYSQTMENQCVIGYNGSVLAGHTRYRVMMILDNLAAQKTAAQARSYAVSKFTEEGVKIRTLSDSTYRTIDRLSDVPVYGDLNARMKGVYTGSAALAIQGWYY